MVELTEVDYDVLKELRDREFNDKLVQQSIDYHELWRLEYDGLIEIKNIFCFNRYCFSRYILTFKGHVALAAYLETHK